MPALGVHIVFLGHALCLQVKLTKDKALLISGQHNVNKEIKNKGHSQLQRTSSSFARRYQLPENTDSEHLTAKLQDGVLTLTVPKAALPEVTDQEILIQDASADQSKLGAGSMEAHSTSQGSASKGSAEASKSVDKDDERQAAAA